MEKNQKRENKGITLIALVITIIVLLILAAVTINLTLGERGIFTTAQIAAKNYTNSQNRELAELEDFNYDLEYVATGSSEKEWNEEKGVNEPQVKGTGLQPVTIVADGDITTVEGNMAWYNYQTTPNGAVAAKTWANAKSTGTTTDYDSYWVWIPRYAYKLDEKAKTIDIVFLKGTTDRPAPKTADGVDSSQIIIKRAKDISSEEAQTTEEDGKSIYIVHPAFTNESGNGYANGGWDREIPGFWIAKFEAGYVGEPGDTGAAVAIDSPVQYSTIQTWDGSVFQDQTTYYYGTRAANNTKIKWPTFQPYRPSMNYVGISDAYDLCRQIGNTSANDNPYQLKNVDSHMIKNSEWGAVAYLSYSDYGQGRATEVTINNRSAGGSENVWAVTGYAGDTPSATIEEFNLNELTAGSVKNPWYSTSGDNASTTGNVSGVYDMSGCNWEWVSGYGCFVTNQFTDFAGKLNLGGSNKYKSEYVIEDKYGGESEKNFQVNKPLRRKGEAIWETCTKGYNDSSWYSDYSGFVDRLWPFFIRGGDVTSSTKAGIFGFERNGGGCYKNVGFRAILVCE